CHHSRRVCCAPRISPVRKCEVLHIFLVYWTADRCEEYVYYYLQKHILFSQFSSKKRTKIERKKAASFCSSLEKNHRSDNGHYQRRRSGERACLDQIEKGAVKL